MKDQGVPVYRTDQAVGEFVITFPRAYHAGFNRGFNLAEAANFAAADWIARGRMCVNYYYSSLGRNCVFSHDELICKMALDDDGYLIPSVASAAYDDSLLMLKIEEERRREVLEWGVTCWIKEHFELLADDSRRFPFVKRPYTYRRSFAFNAVMTPE